MRENTNIVEILIVEDNRCDVDLVREAFAETKLDIGFVVASDGIEAMNILRERLTTRKLPDMILLDLNLPRKDGREVLKEVKSHPVLKSIPVVILTTSSSSEDLAATYCMSANSYIKKPTDFKDYIRIGKAIEEFWFGIVERPEKVGCVSL